MALASPVETLTDNPPVICVTGAGNAPESPGWQLIEPAVSRLNLFGLLNTEVLERLVSRVDFLGALHSDVTEGLYRNLGGVVSDEIVVPPNFGIATPSFSYRLAKGAISKAIEQHGQPVRLRGHSLGGYIAIEYAHEHPEEVIEVDAWSAPLDGVSRVPVINRFFRERTKKIIKMREEMGSDAPTITLVGSDGDRVVPSSSSVAYLPEAQRFLFTSDRDSVPSGVYPIVVDHPPDHVGILSHPAGVPLHEGVAVRPRLLSVV